MARSSPAQSSQAGSSSAVEPRHASPSRAQRRGFGSCTMLSVVYTTRAPETGTKCELSRPREAQAAQRTRLRCTSPSASVRERANILSPIRASHAAWSAVSECPELARAAGAQQCTVTCYCTLSAQRRPRTRGARRRRVRAVADAPHSRPRERNASGAAALRRRGTVVPAYALPSHALAFTP